MKTKHPKPTFLSMGLSAVSLVSLLALLVVSLTGRNLLHWMWPNPSAVILASGLFGLLTIADLVKLSMGKASIWRFGLTTVMALMLGIAATFLHPGQYRIWAWQLKAYFSDGGAFPADLWLIRGLMTVLPLMVIAFLTLHTVGHVRSAVYHWRVRQYQQRERIEQGSSSRRHRTSSNSHRRLEDGYVDDDELDDDDEASDINRRSAHF